MNNMSVYKAHDLIDASYRLNAQSQKLVLACLGKIDSRPETQPQKEVKLTASEFSELMDIDMKNAHRELYKAADSLFKSSIILHEGDEEIELYWIQEKAKKLKGEGAITIIWSDRILRYICQLKGRFTKFKLRNIASLQSGHSIRLYELLMRFNSTGIRNISLADFRSALGLEDKYTEFKILNRAVIKPSVKELNQRSDLVISYTTIKKGRSVAGLSFEFKQNQQMKMNI
mgnify:CR=1 FL=1